MPYVEVENLVEKCGGSVYKMVITAAKRALEIAEGQPKLTDASPSIKPSTIALYEIDSGKISCKKTKSKE